MGPARPAPRAGPEHPVPDAPAGRQRGRLHELPRQRRLRVRARSRPRPGSTCSASSTRSTGCRTSSSASTRSGRPNAICEAAICYTGDILDPKRDKYSLKYFVDLAKELEKLGTHFLAIKDMAGLLKPYAAKKLVKALRRGGRRADPLPHPRLGRRADRVVPAGRGGGRGHRRLRVRPARRGHHPAEPERPRRGAAVHRPRHRAGRSTTLQETADYWEERPQRTTPRSRPGSSPARPRSTCTRCPAGSTRTCTSRRSRSASATAGTRSCRMYAEVNQLFGDIVKVTPTSKVVGDMALFMVANNLTPADVLDPKRELAFPESVVEFFEGKLGQPPGGFPPELQARVLRGRKPLDRPARGDAAAGRLRQGPRRNSRSKLGRTPTDQDVVSYLLYPKVFADFAEHQAKYSDLSVLPTPVFFYGMETGEEVSVEIEPGKTLIIKFLTVGDPHAGRQAAGVLRAERPAARGAGHGPVARRTGPRRPGRRPSRATRCTSRPRCRGRWSAVAVAVGRGGGGRAEAAHAGSDEDGDDALRRAGREGGRGAGPPRHAGRGRRPARSGSSNLDKRIVRSTPVTLSVLLDSRFAQPPLDAPTITAFAGTGEKGFAGDGGPAAKAKLDQPFDVAFDKAGNLYFSDTFNHRIRRVDAKTGVITTVAGNGKKGFGGDGGKATDAQPERALRDRTRRRRQPLHRGPAELLHPPGGREDRHHHAPSPGRAGSPGSAATAGPRTRPCSSSRTASASTARESCYIADVAGPPRSGGRSEATGPSTRSPGTGRGRPPATAGRSRQRRRSPARGRSPCTAGRRSSTSSSGTGTASAGSTATDGTIERSRGPARRATPATAARPLDATFDGPKEIDIGQGRERVRRGYRERGDPADRREDGRSSRRSRGRGGRRRRALATAARRPRRPSAGPHGVRRRPGRGGLHRRHQQPPHPGRPLSSDHPAGSRAAASR